MTPELRLAKKIHAYMLEVKYGHQQEIDKEEIAWIEEQLKKFRQAGRPRPDVVADTGGL